MNGQILAVFGFVINLIILLIGTLGNLLLLSCFLRYKKLCNAVNIFLIAHAVFGVVLQLPLGIEILVFYGGRLDTASYGFCVFIYLSKTVSIVTQVFSTLAVGLYRYLAVVKVHPLLKLKKWRTALYVCISSYGFMMLATTMSVFIAERGHNFEESQILSLNWCHEHLIHVPAIRDLLISCSVVTAVTAYVYVMLYRNVRRRVHVSVLPDNSNTETYLVHESSKRDTSQLFEVNSQSLYVQPVEISILCDLNQVKSDVPTPGTQTVSTVEQESIRIQKLFEMNLQNNDKTESALSDIEAITIQTSRNSRQHSFIASEPDRRKQDSLRTARGRRPSTCIQTTDCKQQPRDDDRLAGDRKSVSPVAVLSALKLNHQQRVLENWLRTPNSCDRNASRSRSNTSHDECDASSDDNSTVNEFDDVNNLSEVNNVHVNTMEPAGAKADSHVNNPNTYAKSRLPSYHQLPKTQTIPQSVAQLAIVQTMLVLLICTLISQFPVVLALIGSGSHDVNGLLSLCLVTLTNCLFSGNWIVYGTQSTKVIKAYKETCVEILTYIFGHLRREF